MASLTISPHASLPPSGPGCLPDGLAAGAPYAFHRAQRLTDAPACLGEVHDWQAEWKCDGIRVQLVKRAGRVALWSRSGICLSIQFPTVVAAAAALPDCVLDGELLAYQCGRRMPPVQLQEFVAGKHSDVVEALPIGVVMLAFDVLEAGGVDWRERPLEQRRSKLHGVVYGAVLGADERHVIQLSDIVRAPSWPTLAVACAQAGEQGLDGLVLKRRDSSYIEARVAAPAGIDWWTWQTTA